MKRADISDREALEACNPWGGGDTFGSALAKLSEKYPAKVAQAKLEQLSDRDLIDYGVSIGYPWRTPEGESVLLAFQADES